MRFVRLSKSVLLALLLGLVLVTFVQANKDESAKDEKGDIAFGDDADGDTDEKSGEKKKDEKKEEEKDKSAVIDIETETVVYRTVKPEGLAFIEDFQEEWEKTWTHSKNSMYGGVFQVGTGANPEIPGDKGLIIPLKAKHYGISALVPGLSDLTKDNFVVQYEVRMDEGMTCGGAYLKFLTTEFTDPEAFDNSATYSVMFGPDKCGATDKVHFILQSKNPKTGKFMEHHLKGPPSVPSALDKNTHLYTLIVKKDGTFEILIDQKSKRTGKLSEDFEPPIQPPKEIDDKDDTKPETWVDEKKIPDPNAKKPDDWDEDAPMEIPDESATKPEKWDESKPKEIPDPKAKKPEGWDDEEDGEWVPKMIPNPDCKDGCGPWKRPMIRNPKYKGKWSPPMVDNPEYKGEWKPRKIPNPEYYEVSEPSLLGIGGIGIEVWTMDQGVVFDNIVLGTNVDAAKEYARDTWMKKNEAAEKKRKEKEEKEAKEAAASSKNVKGALKTMDRYLEKLNDLMEPIEEKLADMGLAPLFEKMSDYGFDRPMIIVVTLPLVIVFMFLMFLTRGKRRAPRAVDSEAKKTDKVTKDDDAAKTDKVEEDGKSTETAEKSEGVTSGGVRKRKVATTE